MTIVQLEYLLAVVNFGSFSLAAERSFVTQPSLSMQIKNLEEELGVVLLDRSRKPVIATESPYLWMNAAEITFLRAEGALRGWNMGGDAKSLYEQAITLSFDQYGLTGADAYVADSQNKPQAYTDPMRTYSVAAPASTITIAWQDGDDKFEANLERIITQKWIAMFPCTVEAWSE